MRLWIFFIVCSIGLVSDLRAQTSGCTDPKASNYNSGATVNDGSCLYANTTASSTVLYNLPGSMIEISGMIYWNNKIWAINDGGSSAQIHEVDPSTGVVSRSVTITGATNVDWEDIAQDNDYIYIGDFGNNANGARTDLKIYKVAKADLSGSVITATATIINFIYSNQSQPPTPTFFPNTTNFDCEAMVVLNGKIFLFTKQWSALQTSLYELSTTPGTQTATLKSSFNVNGLITGADNWGSSTIVLTGHEFAFSNASRFLYLLYDFTPANLLDGNKRRLELIDSKQTESVSFFDANNIYIANEGTSGAPFGTFAQSVESVNLTSYLDSYYLLPISSIDLKTRLINNTVQANWDILPASDFASGFLQRKAATESSFQNIHILPGASGIYTDKQPPAGQIAYRIKAKDTDGKDSYSKTVSINVPATVSNLQFQQQKLTVNGTGSLEIISMSGNLITSEKVSSQKSIDMQAYPKGAYIARFTDASGRSTSLKFIH